MNLLNGCLQILESTQPSPQQPALLAHQKVIPNHTFKYALCYPVLPCRVVIAHKCQLETQAPEHLAQGAASNVRDRASLTMCRRSLT